MCVCVCIYTYIHTLQIQRSQQIPNVSIKFLKVFFYVGHSLSMHSAA